MDQLTRPSTPLATLSKAIARISRSRSVETAIDSVRETARSVIGCEGIALILKEGSLCHYVEEDATGPLWKGQKFPASACVSGWSMLNKATAVIPDITRDDRIPHELYAGTFVRALAMAPIRAEAPIGAIGAYWSQPYTPADWEVEVLEALAEAAATALENAAYIDSVVTFAPTKAASNLAPPSSQIQMDIEATSSIPVIPMILDVVLRMTGMGFAAVARVTEDHWIACQVLDPSGFGLTPGDELPIESTLCNEIRGHRQTIVFDDACDDPQYRDHHTPRIYGLRSYISKPIILHDGTFWGTLCAIDPSPAKLDNPQILGAFKLFAELIAHHLDSDKQMELTKAALVSERELAELREQFIAVLGHDLRNPIAAINAGTSRLLKEGWTERSPLLLNLMQASLTRMSGLVENVMDLARVRLGGGLLLSLNEAHLKDTVLHVVNEVIVANPTRSITATIDFEDLIVADHARIGQLVSNLLANAVIHGAVDKPIEVSAKTDRASLIISVKNGGAPIAKIEIDKLFLPFKRGVGRSGVAGLGLGLYIASQIAQAHGGRIVVDSNAVETRFSFCMPLIRQDDSENDLAV